jgi:glycosyltransferase involved in cell wall biosynthesis
MSVSVIHTIAGMHARSGGPSRAVAGMCDSLASQQGLSVTLMAPAAADEKDVESASVRVSRVATDSTGAVISNTGLSFRRTLRAKVNSARPSIIHNHGLWTPVNYWACNTAFEFGIPLVIQPHGMLAPWALQHKSLKKRIAMNMFQRRQLDGSVVLIATSEVEYQNIRRLGINVPVAIVPNGVDLTDRDVPAGKSSQAAGTDGTVLFLSRVHPVKGLLNLVQAWAQSFHGDWKLVIAGPDEGGHLASVLSLVRRLGLQDSVRYVGEVNGDEKGALYRSADIFVLPTFTENFGLVIAEALAYGVPVITTRGAPWSDLERFGCGWWVDIGVDPLSVALKAAMATTGEERRAMGAKGRGYVSRFALANVARQMVEVYRWVLGHAPLPAHVHLR